MKIGILTYHFGTNFGGQLQCYALSKVLESLGHNVVVVNYSPTRHNDNILQDVKSALRCLKSQRSVNATFAVLFYSRGMRRAFHLFQSQHLNIGPSCELTNFADVYPNLDALVVGSDQVWAPAHHDSAAYFFNFKETFTGRKISYAPCCAINRVEDKNKEKISSLLVSFNAISARNIETQHFVKDLIGKEVPIVSDPTFLHSFEEFSSPKVPKKKYILTYILGEEIIGGHKNVIEKIKKDYGDMPVYSINLTASKPHYFSWSDKTYHTLDPVDWVAFIKSASFLYTDSFHGVVFAMKFNIPFLAYYKERIRASRFIDLIERFNLKNIIDCANAVMNVDLSVLQPNESLQRKIESAKEVSMNYLKNALS